MGNAHALVGDAEKGAVAYTVNGLDPDASATVTGTREQATTVALARAGTAIAVPIGLESVVSNTLIWSPAFT